MKGFAASGQGMERLNWVGARQGEWGGTAAIYILGSCFLALTQVCV